MKIIETKKTYNKVDGKWKLQKEETREISKEYYINTTSEECKRVFQSLGGYERYTKSYTVLGYVVTHINSLSPKRQTKITRDFTII